jgi:UPF0755 protein
VTLWIRKFFGYAIIAFSLGAGWLWFEYDLFISSPLYQQEEGAVYTVRPGSSVRTIANELHQAGMMKRPSYFVWLARFEDKAHRIQAGEYSIWGTMTPVELLADMTSGKVIQYPLTVVEGWNFKQLREAISSHEALTHTIDGLSDAEVMAKLGYPDQHPEGRFFPDTYKFPRGTTDIEFLKRAYRAMDEHLNALWLGREEGLPFKTPYEALILASIVEKETAVPEERKAIAGVFVRRLQKRMRLQTDPTIIYGMGDSYDGNIRKRDLKKDTPYNTYTRRGLTPTPIAMPSLAAIEAALHPQKGDTLYFVAKGDGSHHFSSSLEEHNWAVIKYQLNGKRRPFSSMK